MVRRGDKRASSNMRRLMVRLAAACALVGSSLAPAAAAPKPAAEQKVALCQALGPAAPYPIAGLDGASAGCGEPGWRDARPIDWQKYAQGEYLGHERLEHVPQYRLRVGDELDVVFRISREPLPRAYRLNVGDRVRIESLADSSLDRELIVQPDGTITLPLLGQVYAARAVVSQLRDELERRYQQFYKQPAVTVTPLKVNEIGRAHV